jgi:hypothetical protein
MFVAHSAEKYLMILKNQLNIEHLQMIVTFLA